jgi:hypothetical protein
MVRHGNGFAQHINAAQIVIVKRDGAPAVQRQEWCFFLSDPSLSGKGNPHGSSHQVAARHGVRIIAQDLSQTRLSDRLLPLRTVRPVHLNMGARQDASLGEAYGIGLGQ